MLRFGIPNENGEIIIDCEKTIHIIKTIDKTRENLGTNEENRNTLKVHKKTEFMKYQEQTLRQYCISNGYNYGVILNIIQNYNKNIEEAIEIYKKNGQKLPTKWIYEKYGILLKHLFLEEHIDYKPVVSNIRKNGVSLDEALEEYIVSKILKERGIRKGPDREMMKDLYYLLNYGDIKKADVEEYIRDLYITSDELELINEVRNKFNKLKRKELLYEFGEAIGSYPTEEMIEMMNLYHITEEEIETIFLKLYSKFKFGILLQSEQEESKQREQINNYILQFDDMTEEEKVNLEKRISADTYKAIEETAEKIKTFKLGLIKNSPQGNDKSIIDLMREAVGKQVGENASTRVDLSSKPKINSISE